MKIYSWNVRGCNNLLKQKEVSDFFRSSHLDVFGILETRIKEHNAAKVIGSQFKGYVICSNYAHHPNGRIWIVWNTVTVTVTPLSIHAQFIHCFIQHNSTRMTFHATFTYARNDGIVRESLWQSLIQISSTVQAWIVLGDFNVVRDASERISSYAPNLSDILAFNACILNCQLEDMHSLGCEFTWTNNQDNEARMWSKLDRGLVNENWIKLFPSYSVWFCPAGVSDHSPALVTIFEEAPRRRRFSYLNCWSLEPDFPDLVKSAWSKPVSGSPMYRFFAKLKNARQVLCSFHRQQTSSIQDHLIKLKGELATCQENIQRQPLCCTLLQLERDLKQKYLKLQTVELIILRQRAKMDRIIYNDASTRLFYAKINERAHGQLIGEIFDHRGQRRLGLEQVAEGFITYYTDLLGAKAAVNDMPTMQGACVLTSDWDTLVKPVQVEEIRDALKGIDPYKSPGPDGFSSGFFHATWDIMGDDLTSCIQEFFRSGHMIKQANSTLLTLIPKKKVVSSVLDFRPIACCTTVYKIISKILVVRLQSILPSIIGPEQAAFIKGRSIFDNILLTQHLIKNYTRKFLTPRCLIKVDIRKAFDSLQ
ncbi:hypothetical protein RND81_10G021200 [Saponaria officinalis]|uniref:Reverse transcriptase domain-containing protein n=1 Tax=Saponaria officinalis TaxID=3572 RepID=A0AAW1HZI5_SAPOF